MGTAAFQSAFTGKVEQNEFVQIYDFQTFYSESGSYLGRELVTQKVNERTYKFSGLSYTDAHSTASVTVTDANNNSYTVPMASSFRDGSTGTKVFEVYSCNVVRSQLSPHLWEVTVRTRDSEYFVNGVKIDLPND